MTLAPKFANFFFDSVKKINITFRKTWILTAIACRSICIEIVLHWLGQGHFIACMCAPVLILLDLFTYKSFETFLTFSIIIIYSPYLNIRRQVNINTHSDWLSSDKWVVYHWLTFLWKIFKKKHLYFLLWFKICGSKWITNNMKWDLKNDGFKCCSCLL